MANYQKVTVPVEGVAITVNNNGALVVPDRPIIPFIEGEGIGPDIMTATQRVLNAAVRKAYDGVRRIVWVEVFAGEKALAVYGKDQLLPKETLDAIREFVVALKGPLGTPVSGGYRSLNVALRQELELYACVRPVKYFPGVPSPLKHPEQVDVVIFRENMEDLYAGIEWPRGSVEALKLIHFIRDEFYKTIREDSGIGIKPISVFGTKRLVRKALQYALKNGRKSVTLVHKGNILKYTDGAFKKWGYDLAREEFSDTVITEDELYARFGGKAPEDKVVIKDRIADNMFQQLLTRPTEYDVLAMPNLNGDFFSDFEAGQVGGLGVAPGANIGESAALFEATHGTAPKYANKNVANPTALILSGVMMLEYLGWNEAANLVTKALTAMIAAKCVTQDFARQSENTVTISTAALLDALQVLIAKVGAKWMTQDFASKEEDTLSKSALLEMIAAEAGMEDIARHMIDAVTLSTSEFADGLIEHITS